MTQDLDRRSAALSVAVVNDYRIVSAGLARLLAPYAERVAVAEYTDGLPERGSVDVVLFDPFGHPQPRARLVEIVASTGAKVAVFGWGETDREVEDARRLGAAGHLSKTSEAAQLVAALEAIAQSEDWLLEPGGSVETPVTWPGQDAGLTQRESEVVCLITQGLSNVEIGKALYLSINSIKTYVRTAYRKMGVRSRTEAVLWGIDHGMRPVRRLV